MKLPAGLTFFERGWLSANNLLFIDEDSCALVDTGYASHAPQTLALVQNALEGRTLDRILNTHLHSDHCGGNAALQAHYGSHTSIPAAQARAVAEWNEDLLSYRATGQHCPRFAFNSTLAHGDRLHLGGQEWQALAAPGHDPHSLVLYCEAEDVLASADALWENGFGVVFPELEGVDAFHEVRATLDMIAELKPRLVLPGHGAPFSDVARALDRAYARLDYLAADPVRNAQNGVKVLVKFRLLEKRSVSMMELTQWMREVPLLASCKQRYLGMDDEALAQWVAQQLVKAGAARLCGETLQDC